VNVGAHIRVIKRNLDVRGIGGGGGGGVFVDGCGGVSLFREFSFITVPRINS
jgi:hypothetical protein